MTYEMLAAELYKHLRHDGYLTSDNDLSMIIWPLYVWGEGKGKDHSLVYAWITEEHWASCQDVRFCPRMKHCVFLTWLNNHIT